MVNKENQSLSMDFLDYLRSVDRSEGTIKQYKNDMDIFFVWNMENNQNKLFTEITKRELVRFQNHALNEWRWGPKRIRRMKSALSSLSKYIEDILDDEYPDFRSIINKIASPANKPTWEKSIFTDEELEGLLDHLVARGEVRKAAALALAMYSGRRKAEIQRFKVSFFENKNVIFDSFWKTDEKIQTKGRGSSGKQIHLYVLKEKFEPYLNLWLDERKREGIISEWLFPSSRDISKAISPATMDDWAREFTEFLGKDFYWHSMRHYFCTMLVRQDVPVNVIQDIIQWESADMVKLYTDISVDESIGRYFGKRDLKLVKREA
jgi:integrase